jgi:nitroreductase
MAAPSAQASLETSPTRLDAVGSALLFTEARTANTFSDRPVTGEQLQAAYFIIAVRAAGLAAGPMGGFDPAGLDAEFFPSGDWRSFLVVNIGHPGESSWQERLPERGRSWQAVQPVQPVIEPRGSQLSGLLNRTVDVVSVTVPVGSS